MNDQERSAFRAFVRENHPDRGGDPEVFVAGLARFGAVSPSGSGADGDTHRDTHRDGAGHPRFDAPVEVVTPLPFPMRVAIALLRTVRHQRNRRVE